MVRCMAMPADLVHCCGRGTQHMEAIQKNQMLLHFIPVLVIKIDIYLDLHCKQELLTAGPAEC